MLSSRVAEVTSLHEHPEPESADCGGIENQSNKTHSKRSVAGGNGEGASNLSHYCRKQT
jgi:hypothetical protein